MPIDTRGDSIEALATAMPLAATGRLSMPLHHAFIRYLILRMPIEGYMSLCQVIATTTKPNFAAIKVPLLIIVGSEDMIAPMSGCDTILKTYSIEAERKKVEILDDIGHWHCIEGGDVVGRHIKNFVIGIRACES